MESPSLKHEKASIAEGREASAGMFSWWQTAPANARRALFAAALGWMLDSFDVMLFALVLASLMTDLALSKGMAGILGSITLAAAAIGGLVFGVVADRYGRTRALMASILIYAVFTAACGLSQSFMQLAIFRLFVGFGMGGEWASGASLVAESWPDEHRGKALGLMQSAWAIGYALAAVVAAVVMPWGGWRAVFFVGVAPAFFTFWIRSGVTEPELWKNSIASPASSFGGFLELFQSRFARFTIVLTLMNACTLFAWWGFNLWMPAYLSLPAVARRHWPDPTHNVGHCSSNASRYVVWICHFRLCERHCWPKAHVCCLSTCRCVVASSVWQRAHALAVAYCRLICRIFWHWLLLRLCCRHCRNLSHSHPGNCSGFHL